MKYMFGFNRNDSDEVNYNEKGKLPTRTFNKNYIKWIIKIISILKYKLIVQKNYILIK